MVRVAPGGSRAYRNAGEAPMYFIVLQVKNGSEPAGGVADGVPQGKPQWPAA